MMMQLIWLVFIYFLTGLTDNQFKKKSPSLKRNIFFGSFKSILILILVGLGGVLTADWLSEGNPLWPALGLVSVVTGALFPLWRQPEESFKTGVVVYFGGVFYLKPIIALTGFSFAFEVLLLSKDPILTAIIFSSSLPILFAFLQVNPYFFWAAVVIQLVFIIKLRNEIKSRISEFFRKQKDMN